MKRQSVCVLTAVAACGTGAGAQMLGSELQADWRFPTLGAPIESHLITVGAGVELPWDQIINDNAFDLDVGDATVSFIFRQTTTWQDVEFNGWYFEDVHGVLPQIVGYGLDSYSGSGSVFISSGWSDDAFWASLSGSQINEGDVLTLRVLFVPAPTGVACVGMAGLVGWRRRR